MKLRLRDAKITVIVPDASVRVLLLDFDVCPRKPPTSRRSFVFAYASLCPLKWMMPPSAIRSCPAMTDWPGFLSPFLPHPSF